MTNENALFKAQAKFLVDRQDLALWGKVLTDANPHKRALVDQVSRVEGRELRVSSGVKVPAGVKVQGFN